MKLLIKTKLGLSLATFFLACYFIPTNLLDASETNIDHKAIGMNLLSIKDWSSELVFNDYFKRARPWINNKPSLPLKLDSHGWVKALQPRQTAQTYILTDFQGHFPSKIFTCLYEGEGLIEFPDAIILKQQQGRLLIRLKEHAQNLSLMIKRTNPTDYIHNIQIYSGDTIQTATFRPDFLERWKPFSAIRFMDWMQTNNSKQKNWSDRAHINDFSQASRKGVSLEYMIELANTLNISPWFCMPHQATDAYVRNFATLVKKTLKPNLHIYIEYSNEVWNQSFKQHQYAQQEGERLDLSKHEYLQPIRYYSQRSVEIFHIWKSVFNEPHRLVRVLSGQAVATYMTTQILTWRNAWKYADAYAIGDYFGGGINKALLHTKKKNQQTLFNLLQQDLKAKKQMVQQQQSITAAKHLQLFAYEGGQHLVVRNNPKVNILFDRINRSPQMNTLYSQHLNNWFASNGALFMHFGSVSRNSKYGRWGALEWYDQNPTDTKYAVLRNTQKTLFSAP